ncbi:MAG TPA: hypothetical protein VF503_22665 [Sphingobium sp.]|uniref:hypothetical protein n=1 Tax=Sphingobium sp. TaxID=1912891 RepID=UPI002ED00C55
MTGHLESGSSVLHKIQNRLKALSADGGDSIFDCVSCGRPANFDDKHCVRCFHNIL